MILEKYTTEELASVFEGVNDKGVMAFLVLELKRISAELEEVKRTPKRNQWDVHVVHLKVKPLQRAILQ